MLIFHLIASSVGNRGFTIYVLFINHRLICTRLLAAFAKSFSDVNHQKVTQQSLTTNEYGSFNGIFTIPKGLLNGQMQIYTAHGSKYVSVEEYKRPKFEVEILPFKGNYVLNDSVSIKGKANSFASSLITDAEVKYRITRKPVWRGWWYYSIPAKEVQMAEGKLITDNNGEFEIKFVALPDLTFGKDKNNRYYKHNTIVTVPYTNKKLDITFETFRNKLYPGQKEEWKLKISEKNGDKIAAEMLATLYDASLDKFMTNSWSFNIYNKYYSRLNWNSDAFAIARAKNISKNFYKSSPMPYRKFDYFNWFGFSYYSIRHFDIDYDENIELGEVVEDEGARVKKANGG